MAGRIAGRKIDPGRKRLNNTHHGWHILMVYDVSGQWIAFNQFILVATAASLRDINHSGVLLCFLIYLSAAIQALSKRP